MERLGYGGLRHEDDEDLTPDLSGPPTSFEDGDRKAARDAADPQEEDEPLAKAVADRQVTSDSLAASFHPGETPDPSNRDAVGDKLQSDWNDFQALHGRTAHESEGIRQFHHAAVYAHANPLLADPQGKGPLDYMHQQPAYQGGSHSDVLAHPSVAYQNLIATETNRLWGHLSPNLERGVEAIPQIAERLEASSRHITNYTLGNFSVHGENHQGLSWQNSREQNEQHPRDITKEYTDWSAFGSMADSLTTQAHEQGRTRHAAAFREDEACLLYATANSAHNELLWDRAELRQLTQQLEHANVNAPDHNEKLKKALDLMVHMDYTAGLHGHVNESIEEILAAEQSQAEYEGSLRRRIGQLFESFRNRLFGSDEDETSLQPAADPAMGYSPHPSHQPLHYPNADAFDDNSSLTELTDLAFDRVHNPLRGQAVDDHMQPLWEIMKSPRGDGDFWQAAAYGASNRELLDPRSLGVDEYMNYRPGLGQDTETARERGQELLAHAYRRNAALLYNEPQDVWQPGQRDDDGLLIFDRIHRTLHAAKEGGDLHWTGSPEERRDALHHPTGGPENPEAITAYAARTEDAASLLNHPQRESLQDRDDAAGLLYHAGILAEVQTRQLNQDLHFQINILANPEATEEMRNSAWLNASDALVHMDYLTGLQDYTARQTEEQLRAERSQDEERARQRSVIGRLRSLFGTKAQVEDPVA